MTVERVDDGVLCTLDTGGFIYFDSVTFATTIANAILRVSMFENQRRIHVDHHGRPTILPDEYEALAQTTAPAPADDFDGSPDGTGEPPC